jgi:hypothetical protein
MYPSSAEKTFGELIKSKQISEFKKLLKGKNKKILRVVHS